MARQGNEIPGLKWRKRAHGARIPYWIAPPQALKAGFKIRTWNLSRFPLEDIPAICQRMHAEAIAFAAKWKAGIAYDGTIASLINLYQVHQDSSFKRLKPTSLGVYGFYSGRIAKVYGARRIADLTGLDIMRWHETWRAPPDGRQCLAAAAMALSVLKAALNFGEICGFKDCARLRRTISNLRLPSPKPRQEAPDAQVVRRAMDAARGLGHPSASLAYALQFETVARQYDVVGQWVPLSDSRTSCVTWRGKKWIGPTWANVDANLILMLTPSKTETTTGRRVLVDLKLCPLVMAEIASIPLAARIGPLIVNEKTGAPFRHGEFKCLWAAVRAKAGLRPTLWNRDLRAGGLTEGSMAGASSDDRAKFAAHSKRTSQRVYDRDVLVSSSRVNEARARFREGKE